MPQNLREGVAGRAGLARVTRHVGAGGGWILGRVGGRCGVGLPLVQAERRAGLTRARGTWHTGQSFVELLPRGRVELLFELQNAGPPMCKPRFADIGVLRSSS